MEKLVKVNQLINEQEQEKKEFVACMQQTIDELCSKNNFPAMRLHKSVLNSFIRFVASTKEEARKEEMKVVAKKTLIARRQRESDKPLYFDDVYTPGCLKSYQDWLLRQDASWNTVSTYMRRLQVNYNRFCPPGSIGHDLCLFDHVHTKVDAPTKRSLEQSEMTMLLSTDLSKLPKELRPTVAYFLLMFYFRGMPFIDLAHLRKTDLKNNVITYHRHKTGRQLSIRIPKKAQALFEEYRNRQSSSPYLFPILDCRLRDGWEIYLFYQKALRKFNKELAVAMSILLPGVKVSSYTARHSWATLAFHAEVAVGIICQALGHSSIRVTETYLRPFSNSRVDDINDYLIAGLMKERPINIDLKYNVLS